MVENAETDKPEGGVFIMLYTDDIDSLPLTVLPNFLTKTNEQGKFSFHNLKPKHYKIFALKDINSDFKYNLPNELIAFADSMFEAKKSATDSLLLADTASLIILRMFQEADTVQLLSPYLNPQKGIYHFPFKLPIKSFDFQIESSIPMDFFSMINPTRDTLSLYLKTFFTDTVFVYILTDYERIDTVELLPYRPPQRLGRNQQTTAPTLNITLSNKDDLYRQTLLNFSYPVKPVDSVSMLVIATLLSRKDTTEIYLSVPDSFVMQVPVLYKFEPKINYTLKLRDSLTFGYNDATNDSVVFSFSKKTEKDYGNLIIHYKTDNIDHVDYIVDLLSSNQKLIRKDIISSSKTVEYKHLLPGSYHLKVVEDRNKNGKWDTGNYRKKIQPENIFTIDKEIIIKGFWDIEEDVELRVRH